MVTIAWIISKCAQDIKPNPGKDVLTWMKANTYWIYISSVLEGGEVPWFGQDTFEDSLVIIIIIRIMLSVYSSLELEEYI